MTSSTPGRAAEGTGRRACVTGASSGIGEAFARRLARDGYDLLLVARNRERLVALADGLGRNHAIDAQVHPADLTDPAALEGVAAALAASPPALLVNNAGFGTVGPFAELDVAREESLLRLNVWAVVRLTRAVLPGMIARGHGAVINVSSLAGEQPAPYNASYGASKAFVTSFSQSLAEELRGSGVRIQALLPGFTRTEFQARAEIDASRLPGFVWLTPERVVDASLAALSKGDVLCVPGAGYRALAALVRVTPRALARRLSGAAFRQTLE